MNILQSFLSPFPSRLQVISACSAKKACGSLENDLHLTAEQLDDPAIRLSRTKEPANYSHPAVEMYQGNGHRFVRNAVLNMREHDCSISHYILSAGYGFLNESDLIVPYNITFNGFSKKSIRERGQLLQLKTKLVEIAYECDKAIIILGREYLEAIGLPLPVSKLPRSLAYIAPSLTDRIGVGIHQVVVEENIRRQIGAYSSSAKEKLFENDVTRLFR
jgi:hypothetical protein